MEAITEEVCPWCNGSMRKLYHHGEYAWSDEFSFNQEDNVHLFICTNCGKVKVNDYGTGLKPCPFCGEKAKIYETNVGMDCLCWWNVECTVCEAAMEGFGSERIAIRAWNTRRYESLTQGPIFTYASAPVLKDEQVEAAYRKGRFDEQLQQQIFASAV